MYFCSKVITNTATLTYSYTVNPALGPKIFTVEDSVRNTLRFPVPTNNFTKFKNYKNYVCFSYSPLHKLCSIKQILRTCTYQIYAYKYYNLLSISARLCTIISYISHKRKRHMVFTKPIQLEIILPKNINHNTLLNMDLRISQIYLHQINCHQLLFNTIVKYNLEYIETNPCI